MADQHSSAPLATRVEYTGPGLDDAEMPPTPWPLVSRWLAEAVAADEVSGAASEPNTLDLATVDADGMPDVRPVLMKILDPRGVAFITDAHSAKARQLEANPRAAVALRWPRLYRVIRLRGLAEPLGRDELEAVWVQRPRGAQVAACTSLQSHRITDRPALEQRVAEESARIEDAVGEGPVPMPDGFVGWRVRPCVVEVWAGRESRLHDRVRYTPVGAAASVERVTWEGAPPLLDAEGAWEHHRLQP